MIKDKVNAASLFLQKPLPDHIAVTLQYLRTFKRLPNLKAPETLTEKLIWRKLYQRDPRFTLFSDKVAVKAEIAKLVDRNYITETLWHGSSPEDVPFDSLTPPYVIKVNHSWKGHIFIRSPADVDKPKLQKILRKQLRHSHAQQYREWGYANIVPQILIEPLIATPDGACPEDYKIYVFHGQARFVEVTINRFTREEIHYLDLDWNLLPVQLRWASIISPPVPRPHNLPEMLKVAETIGAQFDFCRVDLYSLPDKVLFGEVAFYPGAGLVKFEPAEWDKKFGAYWQVPARES